MKISEALLLQRDLAEEIIRLKDVAKGETWLYRTREPNAELIPTFDLEANSLAIMRLKKLHRNLSRAISMANHGVDLKDFGILDEAYRQWL